ncbi:MAG TPA: class I SAM-dependent methyltransferase [Acidimicrobiales bacterium]|nr:class I SAM-dependent methyltransferase [Acidimicrobiales bacterium]
MTRDLSATRAFFGERATRWDARFPDDGPKYAQAVRELALPKGATVLDAGCGTGRALPHLRAAVGGAGMVVALDVTPEMLDVARPKAGAAGAALVMGDAMALPLRDAAIDAVFAAGLVPHLDDAAGGLRELCRVVRPGGVLAVFHPIGRVALAARHASVPSDGDTLAPATLPGLLAAGGWRLERLDDGEERYLAVATRVADGLPPQ